MKAKPTTPHLSSYSSSIYHKSFDRCAELFLISVANEYGIPSNVEYPPEIIQECRQRLESKAGLWTLINHLAFDCDGLI